MVCGGFHVDGPDSALAAGARGLAETPRRQRALVALTPYSFEALDA